MNEKIIIILIIICLFLPFFSLAQNDLENGGKIKELIKKLFLIIEETWQKEVLPVWQKMWDWFKENICFKIKNSISSEIEERKGFLKEGIEKEFAELRSSFVLRFTRTKEEIKEDVKVEAEKTGKSLWEKFKEFIKK